jgi:hypothetical protein
VGSAAGPSKLQRISIIYTFPLTLSNTGVTGTTEAFRLEAERAGVLRSSQLITGRGFIGIDADTSLDDEHIQAYMKQFVATRLHESEFDPDVSKAVIIHDASETQRKLSSVATPKYTYAQLDDFTDLIGRTVLGTPQTSRVERKGVLPQAIYLDYSQERLASYGLKPSDLGRVLNARNITQPGGSIDAGRGQIQIHPSGKFESARAIGDVLLRPSPTASPLYLRDLVQISRAYQAPAEYLNFYTATGKDGKQRRSRAITLAIYMRSGEQIQKFGAAIDEKLKQVRAALPADLIIARTSDQPLQVKESVDLFMEALYEAIALVVVIALIGFWEWRSALLMALSIPITLATTFGVAHMLHIDLQQVSHPDHRARLIGGRSGGGQRRDQAATGGREWARQRRMARAHETRARHRLCHVDQYHCVSPVPDADGLDGRFSAQLAHRNGGGAALIAAGCHDVCTAAWLLSAARSKEARTIDGREAHARILWCVLPACRKSDSLAMGRPGRVDRLSRIGRDCRFEIEEPVLSR